MHLIILFLFPFLNKRPANFVTGTAVLNTRWCAHNFLPGPLIAPEY